MEDYDINDGECPKCGHNVIHSRPCASFCDEGWFDEYDDDPINFYQGEEEVPCSECKGTGVETWCPKCGANLSGKDVISDWEDYSNNEHLQN